MFLLGEHAFSTAGARIRFRRVQDVNHDGRIGFDDVTPGATVRLRGRVTEPRPRCQAPTTVVVRKIFVRGG
jgi:hypothetical protein